MFENIIDFDVQAHPEVLAACVKADEAYARWTQAASVAVAAIMKVKHPDGWEAATRDYFASNPIA